MLQRKRRILVVCTANICRSPMAHAIIHAEIVKRQLPLEVNSAGLLDMRGRSAAAEATLVCERAGTPLPKVQSRQLSEDDVEWSDTILVMDPWHRDQIVQRFAVKSDRQVRLLSEFDPLPRGEKIHDPVASGPAEFEACYARLVDCIADFLTRPE